MSLRHIAFVLIACAFVPRGLVDVAQGQDDPSGALSAAPGTIAPNREVPAGLDDAFVPFVPQAPVGATPADARETQAEHRADDTPLALWEQLASLGADERANADIEIELAAGAARPAYEQAAEIAALWEGGAYDAAIEQLRALERTGAPAGLGLAWRVPVGPGGQRLTDIRIGGTRSDAQTMNLDFDAQNGNLFMVVRWGSTTGTSAWTMNTSTDDGLTWSETYVFASSVGLVDVDCAVVDDYVYVGYVVGNADAEARIRRCLVSTGAVDNGFGFNVVLDAGANTIEEVALASNAHDFDNRIYYAVIQSNDILRWAWDEAANGATFTEDSPAGTSAEFGLDMTWDHARGTCDDYVFVSYTSNAGTIRVLAYDSAWTSWTVETGVGTSRNTAISAYEDTIICAFEYPYTEGTGIRYRISYNCGTTWNAGSLAIPDGSSVFGYFEPDVDARDGAGTAITYQAEAGLLDPMYYRTRAGYAPGSWSDPGIFADHDVYTGSDTALAHVPPLAGELFSHGAAYISLDPDNRTLYFDRPGATGAGCSDVTPPVVEISAPASFVCACDSVAISGSVSDPDGTYAGDQLEYRRAGVAAWTVADTAVGARSGVLYVLDMSALPEDFYYIRVVGENECALSASDDTLVYHPNTFGSLELRAPIDGGVHAGLVCFDGTAWTQSCFDRYTVAYRPSGAGAYNPVDPPNSPYLTTVLNDPLASWNTASGATAVPDGDYDVRLQGTNDCGDTATIVHTITVDNTAPVAVLTSPVSCSTVAGVVAISGTASDANLQGWVLQYTGGTAHNWVTIAAGAGNVVNGLLANWNTAGLPECAYTLRLVVTDDAVVSCSSSRNQTMYHTSVNIGTPCPADRADINCDGVIDFSDINPFVQCLTAGCP
jgi:hypothetical protein